jgi:hypothetical protein
MELKLIRNGKTVANKERPKGRSKNGANANTVTAKAANGTRRRNGVTRAGVDAFAKRNGLVVRKARAVANRKHKKRGRRNGTVRIQKVNNGVFGNSKETVISVISLLAGLGITKIESSILTPLAARGLNMIGLGQFAQPLVEMGCAVTINRWAAENIKKGTGKFVMYGGLAMALMDVIQSFLPQTSAYNPFASVNMQPLVLNQPSVIVPSALAAQPAQAATTGTMMRPRVGMNYMRPAFRQVY